MLPVTQIDIFYNGLTLRYQDTINVAVGGTFMKRRPEECYDLIENMTAHHNVWDTSAQRGESSRSITSSSPEIASLTQQIAEINKNFLRMSQSNQQVNVVNPSCETCGGQHHYSECQAAVASLKGTNPIPNPREDIKVITTRSGITLAGPSVPSPNPSSSSSKEVERDPKTTMDQVHISSPGSTPRVPSSVIQPAHVSKSNEILEQNPHQPPIPYPSRLNKEKLQDKYDIQITKFLEIFKKLHFNISLVDALTQILKYAKMLKDLLTNKEKLLELANTPLNENCSAVLLNKLPKKFGDPGKFSYRGTLRNSRELKPTCISLELANRSVTYPVGIAEDVFVQVDKFTFPADFVVVDYNVDPRVYLILGRPFLYTTCALVDVYGEELTLRVSDEKFTFNVESTSKYPHKHEDESINQIDIIDTTYEDHFHEVLNVQKLIHPLSGSPTPSSDPVVVSLSPSVTPFGDSDFLLEETNAFLALDDLIPPEINNGIYDSEGDILFLEKLLNDDPTKDIPPKVLKNDETKATNSSIEEPPELELKNLPPHLEYGFLEGTLKLPVIIAKDLKKEEKD
ncbi:reverse transcriptase domain-containing protein [Tanacetum coccineum]|uniref:Reverse transcriptase domain-containing protein n=1 Tax=Tanacetum coccineum TaxID=301880 RepID=A0ABQ4ZHP4_9ASTR